ncbi:MAG: serine--tRNA ligase [Deltaproteobacteria bacterium]|nr:serine--tRNA ligase [Deltaproteobacteria bacterium]MDH3383162.1 serine--tRNA ligase [Deltaproteobacteria bacterium]
MLDLKFVRENMDYVRDALKRRGTAVTLSGFVELDRARRDILVSVERLRAERNAASEEIGLLRRDKKNAFALMERMKQVSAKIKEQETGLPDVERRMEEVLLSLPNLPDPSVPEGEGEEDNPTVRTWGDPPAFPFPVRDHVDIGTGLDILDFERAAKIAGARFCLMKGAGALLERVLINFMLDVHTRENGYTEFLPPFLANSASFFGTGQLPKFEEDLFRVAETDYYLVPTAEVPVTNIVRDEILSADSLPLKMTAYTPCFRAEAGSHGKDVRGMIRQHQFNKVELVKVCRPEESGDELESLTADAEGILKRLSLPYRVVTLCTGELGFSAAKTYDIEVWLPSQARYREISSCSNFTDFQARRAKIRFRDGATGKTRLAHTLNGSGLAVGRTVVAILENFQQEDGSVIIPEVLRPYMGGMERIGPA